jgi:EAL domain-containing protein (putative c-di-GMP-specific phosphodiesterase class I)
VILDDFGTGNSSLNRLRQLQVEAIKIDSSMVSGLLLDRSAAEAVELILLVAQKLKLRVTAEGIESAKQRDHLQQLGCELGQGYFFSAPLEAKEAEIMLRQRMLGSHAKVAGAT